MWTSPALVYLPPACAGGPTTRLLSPSSLFKRSKWPFSIKASASFTNAIIPPKGEDRISSMNSWTERWRTKWRTYARNAEFDGIKSLRCYAEHRTQQIPYLSPGQQELLETLHLFAVICCSLLDKQPPVRDEATSKKGASQVEQLVSSPWGRWASCHSCWWGRWADLSGRGTRLPSSAQNFPPPPGNIHPTNVQL